MEKVLSILGSTGSIGTTTLDIVSQFQECLTVKALTAYTSVEKLATQIERFKPELVVVKDETHGRRLKEILPSNTSVEIDYGASGYQRAAVLGGVDMVVGAMVGAAGLLPVLAAIDAGKDVALANKETLVMAGELVMKAASTKGVRLFPVDSEHSAIFQCLQGNRKEDLVEILLTASGGPFRSLPADAFDSITPADALNHPNWNMGNKITIDSATLMNKGLEVIEAKWLFDVGLDQIRVVVHPQSIVHSMVAYRDGSVMAQMGVPEMKSAIAYALSFPERLALGQPVPDFSGLGGLTFEAPDLDRFPCLVLAFKACELGGTFPAVLNAANEVVVNEFLKGSIPFTAISKLIRGVMDAHKGGDIASIDLASILAADHWARDEAKRWVTERKWMGL